MTLAPLMASPGPLQGKHRCSRCGPLALPALPETARPLLRPRAPTPPPSATRVHQTPVQAGPSVCLRFLPGAGGARRVDGSARGLDSARVEGAGQCPVDADLGDRSGRGLRRLQLRVLLLPQLAGAGHGGRSQGGGARSTGSRRPGAGARRVVPAAFARPRRAAPALLARLGRAAAEGARRLHKSPSLSSSSSASSCRHPPAAPRLAPQAAAAPSSATPTARPTPTRPHATGSPPQQQFHPGQRKGENKTSR